MTTMPADNPADESGAALRIEALSHRHRNARDSVLRDIALEVRAGKILCLLGPSGCGKTTLLRLIAGLEAVQEGSVRLGDRLLGDADTHVPPEKRGVGMVFQDFALFPHMSTLKNVAFGLRALPRALRLQTARDMLRGVGLAERANDAPHRLSGGEKQRVALARALAPRPQLMLLDEPFSSLDAHLRQQTRRETTQLLRQSRITSVIVTHDPEEAMFIADRIALMEKGRIVQSGTPEELYCAPQSPFAAEFFGEVNRLIVPLRNGEAITPLGAIPAPESMPGNEVEALIRPRAIALAKTDEDGTEAEVVGARLLGGETCLTLRVLSTREILQARVEHHAAARTGQRLRLRLTPENGVFVFARQRTS
ncbi:MAG: ABC transporter ATP-binding protein [Zoogloeaceae bacterium]|jgi:iron(III) transport system ATP-binding protein|nr:ABC transporter ATP-binding protein [Zoogloeaceae bacterium]